MKNQKGSTQSATILTIAIITLLCLAFVIIFFVRTEIAKRAEDKRSAKEIAEYGMTIALDKINQDPAWTAGFNNVSYKNGYYCVTIEKTADSIYRASSTGYVNESQKRVIFTYKLQIDPERKVPKPKTLSMEYQ
jgi:hypothetical protein